MNRRGFTLIELLVVIAIILILMALMGVSIPYLITKARYADTAALIMNLDKGCAHYHVDKGVYPPDDRGGSKSLHYHLGRPKETIIDDDGTTVILKGKPYWQIPTRWLRTITDPEVQPSEIVDAWENEVGYANPGQWNHAGVDIWSAGANGVAEMDPDRPDFEDVNNWTQDF